MSDPTIMRVKKYRPLPDGLSQERIDKFAVMYSGRALSGLDPTITASLPRQARSRVIWYYQDRHGMRQTHPALVALRKLWKDTREELGEFYVSPRNPKRRRRESLPGVSDIDRTGTYTALLVIDPSTPAPAETKVPNKQRQRSGHANDHARG